MGSLRYQLPPPGSRLRLGLLLACLAATGLLPSVATGAAPSPSLFGDAARPRRPLRPAKSPAAALGLQSFVNLSTQLGPAVVNILSTRLPTDEDSQRPGGRSGGREQGAGVIINDRGYILTNNHVVANAADIKVRLKDERELVAKLIGRDERTDIALIKVDGGAAPLPWAPFGDSDGVRIGEWVMAIGNPFGLDHSVTVGIVSAKGRRDVQPGAQPGFFDFIQTDAPMNPGNSGGPLINVRGEVIGINSAINAAGSGIGFAIPSNIARTIAEQLHQRGRVVRSWLGVYPQPVTESLRRAFGLPDRHGALLAEVYAGSPAKLAGLEAGDVIVDYDGQRIERADDLLWLLGLSDRELVAVRYYRGSSLRSVEVRYPPPPPPSPDVVPPGRKPSALGIAVSELTPQLADKLGYSDGPGLVILTVEPGSAAHDAGAERGDIVLRVNDRPVQSLVEYAEAVGRVQGGQVMRLLVRREERKQWHNFWLAFTRR